MSQGNSCCTIAVSQQLGRYLVASRDVQNNELISVEDALIIGPKQATFPVCLSCYRRVDDSYLCSRCGWPLCNESCEKNNSHHEAECQFFVDHGLLVVIDDYGEDSRLYDCITPLRCLILSQKEPEKFQKLCELVSHNDARKAVGIWDVDRVAVVDVIIHSWKITDFSERDIQTVCGILEVNAFEIGNEEASARAVFPLSCLMSHDCSPNTVCTNDSSFQLVVKAALPIAKGSIISTTYTYSLDATARRRRHLKQTKFFECSCLRCRDPAELGTHLSSLLCQKCPDGIVMSEDPLDWDSYWSCHKRCGFRVSSSLVEEVIDNLQQKADLLNYDDIEKMEEFIDDSKYIVHPNNAVLTGIKYYLCLVYGNVPGYRIDEMTPTLLERKKTLCCDLLAIADRVEPGSSKLRETLLRELHSAQEALKSIQNGGDSRT